MREEIIILNAKDKKEIKKQLTQQFGITTLPDKVFFCINKKERVYMINKEVFDVDQQVLRVNSFGLYIGTFMVDGFRLNIEGAQLFGPLATKNVIELSLQERNDWLKGFDIQRELAKNADSEYVLLKYENDFLGSGKVKNNSILNYVPKSRTLKKIFPEE
jgi:NOL1/NOP2/fmu family ribosome biogenesis protein